MYDVLDSSIKHHIIKENLTEIERFILNKYLKIANSREIKEKTIEKSFKRKTKFGIFKKYFIKIVKDKEDYGKTVCFWLFFLY